MTILLKTIRFSMILYILCLSANANSEPKINGISVHSELGAEQFIAALYTDTPSTSASDLLLTDENKAMEIRVLANTLYSRKFKQMWIEGIAINTSEAEMEKHAQDVADFTRILRVRLKQGDILRFNREAGKKTTILINDLLLGTINNTNFFDLLLRTWIGQVPLSSDFKQELLAKGESEPRLLKRFQTTNPSPNRLISLSRALKPPTPADIPTAASPTKIPLDTTVAAAKTTKAPSNPPPKAKAPERTVAVVKKAPPVQKKSPPAPRVSNIRSEPTPEELIDADIFDNEESDSFSAGDVLAQQLYISKLTRWTGRFIKYPRSARWKNQEGTVRVTILLDRNGELINSEITDKSEYDTLNKAAQKTVKDASPYPKVPGAIKGDELRFTVPVAFKL